MSPGPTGRRMRTTWPMLGRHLRRVLRGVARELLTVLRPI
jgi:hypothetical protein